MRRIDALALTSIFGVVACATTVPLDLTSLQGFLDGGMGSDSGVGGFNSGNGGFPMELGGFPVGSGGMPYASGGRSPFPMGTGGRAQGSGGRMNAVGGAPPMMGTGGAARGSGGTTPMPGTGGAATGAGGANCRSTEKVCGGVCVSPAPKTGCGLTGCAPCSITAPANGVVICNANHECDISCLSGFTKNGNTCEGPPPGAGGSTGGGGPAVSCGGQTCPSCSVILGPSCCTSAGKCGCPLIPWTAGFLGCI